VRTYDVFRQTVANASSGDRRSSEMWRRFWQRIAFVSSIGFRSIVLQHRPTRWSPC